MNIIMNLKYTKFKCRISIKFWTSKHLIHNNITPKLMDLRFSIVSDILFITKYKNDHIFGPYLNIDKILSVLDSPCQLLSPRSQKSPKTTVA